MADSLPRPRTTDPTSVPALRWGVIGTGWIADRFVTTVTRNTSQQIVAVGSRSPERAREFAEEHGIEMACGSYEELVAQADLGEAAGGRIEVVHYEIGRASCRERV